MSKKVEEKIMKEINVLGSIEYDMNDECTSWEPSYVCGIYNPDLAWNLRRRAQGKIFHFMRNAGLPLDGWTQFDRFVSVFTGGNLSKAYKIAISNN